MDEKSIGWVLGGSGGSEGVMVGGSVDIGCHKLSETIWFLWS